MRALLGFMKCGYLCTVNDDATCRRMLHGSQMQTEPTHSRWPATACHLPLQAGLLLAGILLQLVTVPATLQLPASSPVQPRLQLHGVPIAKVGLLAIRQLPPRPRPSDGMAPSSPVLKALPGDCAAAHAPQGPLIPRNESKAASPSLCVSSPQKS